MSEVTINAQELTNVAKHLRATVTEFARVIEKFDNTVAAMIEAQDAYAKRLEKLALRDEERNL